MPLLFNPTSTQNVEAAKVLFLQAMTLLMTGAWLLVRLISGLQRFGEPDRASRKVWKSSKLSVFQSYFFWGFLYLAIYAVALVFSIDRNLSLWGTDSRQGTLTVFSLVIFSMLVADTIHSFPQADRLITGVLIGSVPVALYGGLQFMGLDPLHWTTNSISSTHSTIGYSLFLGAYLATVIPFTLGRVLMVDPTGERYHTAPYLLILAIQFTCLMFTLARSAIVALLAGCLVFFLLVVRFRYKWVFVMVSVGILLFGSIVYLIVSHGNGLVTARQQQRHIATVIEMRSLSNQDRLTLWRLTLPLLQRRFLVGYGPETYSPAFRHYYHTDRYTVLMDPKNPTFMVTETRNSLYWDPHNLFLAQLLSVGVVGLAVLVTIISLLTIKTLRLICEESDRTKVKIAAALLGSIAAYLVQAQFNPSGLVPTFMFWLVIGICAGVCPPAGESE